MKLHARPKETNKRRKKIITNQYNQSKAEKKRVFLVLNLEKIVTYSLAVGS
jgi:hypothetical protein